MDTPIPTNKAAFIKTLYLYIVAFVALIMSVVALADIINITLKTFIFTKAEQYYYPYPVEPGCESTTDTSTPRKECVPAAERQKQEKENQIARRQESLVKDISYLIVAVPLFLYHWYLIRRKAE